MTDRDSDVSPTVNPIIRLAASRPVALLMIATAVFVFGLLSLARLPMDLMPEMSYPTVTVRTTYAGAAPEDVEDRVSRRLEQALSVVKGLRRISSISRAETSDVILEFRWDTDLTGSVQNIREKIDQTFLPDEVEAPTILRYDPSLDPVLQIGLVGERPLEELRLLAEEVIERKLETVNGVAAVKVRGGLEREVRIEVDEALTRSRGITVAEISRRLAEENLDRASGLLEEGDVTYLVRTRNELDSLEEIAAIPVRREGDSIVRLADVARVKWTHKDERVVTRIDGRPAVKIEIYREAGANIVELAARVKEELFGSDAERAQLARWDSTIERELAKADAERDSDEDGNNDESRSTGAGAGTSDVAGTDAERSDSETSTDTEDQESESPAAGSGKQGRGGLGRPEFIAAYLPETAELSILSDQSTFIEGSIQDLLQTALIGGLIAILVLFTFLGRLSYTLIVAVSIPFSVVATFAPMHVGGISLNIMSLGGLALGIGMLVDSSIVVLESIFRRREAGDSIFESAVRGASEVGSAVLASTLTTVAVFFPIVFVEGVAGQVFRDQALTVVYSLLASLVVSLTLIPMLASRVLPDRSAGPGEKRRIFWRSTAWARFRWAYGSGSVGVRLLRIVLLPYLLVALILEWIGYALVGVLVALAAVVIVVGRLFWRVGSRASRAPLAVFQWSWTRLEDAYVRLLRGALAHRVAVCLAVAVIVGLTVSILDRLGSELIPEVARGELIVRLEYPVGTPIEVTAARSREYEEKLGRIPGVATVSATIGVDPEDVTASDEGEHTARYRVRLERTREQLETAERRVIGEIHSIFGGVQDHTIDIGRPTLFSLETPVEVEVRGHGLSTLARLSQEVESILANTPGLIEVRSTVAPGSPEHHLYPDREKMMRFGVTGDALASVLRQKNMGEVATRYRDGDRKVDVRVQLAEEDRDSIETLLETVIHVGDDGSSWTLGDFVKSYEVREGPAEIRRVDQQRAAIVSASLAGFDLGRVTESLETRLRSEITVPPEYDIAVAGQKKEMERSRASLLAALLLAIFLVYVVMASQFESLVQPLVILCTIPLAAVGVVWTLYLTGTSLSITAFIGMIMLAGIVVNNAIVLIDQVNRLRADGLEPFAALVEGGRRRLRPIMMTTLTTVFAMFPLTGILSEIPHDASLDWLFGSGEGAEIRAPMAWTVVGGLLTSTLLTLLVVPVVYSLVARRPHSEPGA